MLRVQLSPEPSTHDSVDRTGAIRSSHSMHDATFACPACRIRSTPANAVATSIGGSGPADGMCVSEMTPIFTGGPSARRA
jgi:hypothetical protein